MCERDRTREEVGRGHGRKMEMAGQSSVFLEGFRNDKHWSMTQDRVSLMCQELNWWD